VNKLLLSTNGLALINTLLDKEKFGALIELVSQLLRNDAKTPTDTLETLVTSLHTQPLESPTSTFLDGIIHESGDRTTTVLLDTAQETCVNKTRRNRA